MPRASHGRLLRSHYKGEQRPSKNSPTGWTCNDRARACSSPGLAPHQGTEFCLRIHHFVSGKQNTSAGPFLSPARSHFRLPARGACTTLNLKCEYLGWAQTKITPHHNGQDPTAMGRRRSQAAQKAARKYLCRTSRVLTSSYLTSLISSGLWATRNLLCTQQGSQAGQHCSQSPPCFAGILEYHAISKMLCPKLRGFSARGGLRAPNSRCCCREKPAEPEIAYCSSRISCSGGGYTKQCPCILAG